MRITIFLLGVILLFNSCLSNQDQVNELKNRISELDKKNQKLNDSLSLILKERIYNTQLIAMPEQCDIKTNVPNKVRTLLFSHSELPNYSAYEIKENGERSLIVENQSTPYFDFDFVPEPNKKTVMNISIVLNLDGNEVDIPAKFHFDTRK